MNQEELSMTLKTRAISLGLCQQWQDEWDGRNTQVLTDMYRKGIDFCCKNDYPSLQFIREHFDDKEMLHENSIYLDEKVDIKDEENIPLILNGDCSGIITYTRYSLARIYVKHRSDLAVYCKDASLVWINVYDDAKVKVVASGMAKVIVHKYSKTCTIDAVGNVIIKDRSEN